MQRLTLSIPVGDFVPGDGFHVFGNVDSAGRPAAQIDFDTPLTGRKPRPFWPGSARGTGYGSGLFGGGAFGEVPDAAPADRTVQTPPLYFGIFRFAVKTYDSLSNPSSGEPAEFEVPVNSGPMAVRSFQQSDVNGAGRPVFSFTPPPQLA